jgi:galactonate dehydratase
MKIERIKPLLVERSLLVRVYTDEGIIGTGEAGLWAHHDLVLEAVEDLSEYYVGKDASRIEHHYQTVSRDTHFQGAVLSAAMSAIDIALWDILGKSLNQPVYQLLGGKVREKVKVFANIGGNTLDERAKQAAEFVAQGYTSLRTVPFFEGFEQRPASQAVTDAVEIVRVIREAVGYNIDLGVEIHRNFSKAEIVVFGNAVLPYRLLYIEDPLAPESTESLKYVAANINVPIAAGERSYNLYQFKEIIDTGALAESAFIGVFPHLMGSPINMATYVQLDAAIPNYFLQEAYPAADKLNDILVEPLVRDGGYVVVPDRPGIGLDIREEKLKDHPYRPYTTRGWFREDGSVAH